MLIRYESLSRQDEYQELHFVWINSEEMENSVRHMNHIYTFMVLFWSINLLKMLTEA